MRTLPIPTRIIVLAGAAVALALGLLVVLLLRHGSSAAPSERIASPSHVHRATVVTHSTGSRTRTVRLDQGLPGPLRSALESHDVVVAVVAAPDIVMDTVTVVEAAIGANATHTGFAILDVRDKATARAVATLAPGAGAPTILIIRRPGTIAAEFSGFQDAPTVAQAVLDAR